MIPLYPNSGYAKRRELNQVSQSVRAYSTPLPSAAGGRVSVYPNGTLIQGAPRQGSRRAGASAHPFKLSGLIESGDAKIKVAPGMVNNFVPTIDGTSIVAVPAPTFTVTGASGIIQLKATVDGAGAVTALILESIAGPSVTADTSTAKYKLVGSWTASGGVFTSVSSILNTNLTLYLCNGTAIWEA